MPDLYTNFQARLKVATDLAGTLSLWDRDRNLPRTRLTGKVPTSGVINLTAAEGPITIPLADIVTPEIVYFEASVDGFSLILTGIGTIVLKQAIPNQPAILQMMCSSFTAATVTAGTEAGTLSYFIAGIET